VISVRNYLGSVIHQTADSLELIVNTAQRKGKYDIALYAVDSVKIIGFKFVEQGKIEIEDESTTQELENAAHRIVDSLHKISEENYNSETETIVKMALEVIIKIKRWSIDNEFSKVKSRAESAIYCISMCIPWNNTNHH
jgi:hypothetical protein